MVPRRDAFPDPAGRADDGDAGGSRKGDARDRPGDEPAVTSARAGLAAAPTLLRAVVVVLLVEAVVLMVVGSVGVGQLLGGEGAVGMTLFLVVFAWGAATLLAGTSKALLAGHRWARSPAITVQLFQIVVAVTWLQAAVNPFAIGLLVLACVVIVGLLSPSVVAATGRRAED